MAVYSCQATSKCHKNASTVGRYHAALAYSFPAETRSRNLASQTRGATAISSDDVELSRRADEDPDLPETFVDYEEHPREYFLSAITTVLDVQTRVSMSIPPVRPNSSSSASLIEKVKETHESELINNPEYARLPAPRRR